MEDKNLYPEAEGVFEGVPAQPDTIVEQPEIQPNTQEVAQAAPTPQEDDRERNLGRLRQAREQAEYERDQALRYIKQLEESRRQPEPEDPINWESDEFVEAQHVNRKIKQLENKLSQYERQNAFSIAEARLKSQYNDFDSVVNKENIEALRMAHPEIAESLHQTGDIYTKAVSTYNIIKKFGLAQTDRSLMDKATVARNMAKPRATNSVSPQPGDSPLAKANDFANTLTEERKSQLWQEIQAARRAS